MNLNQLKKKLDEHFTKISETVTQYTDDLEAKISELKETNKQLQTNLNKSEAKRVEAEAKAKEATEWERKYYRIKESSKPKTREKVRKVTRYTAFVQYAGRLMEVGTFDNKEEAEEAEKRAVKELHREEGTA